MKISEVLEIPSNIDYYSIPAISKSFLSRFSISPAHTNINISTPAMIEGTAIHEFCLEPHVFDEKYVITAVDGRTAAYRELKKQHPNKTILRADFVKKLQIMRLNLRNMHFKSFGVDKTMGEIIDNSIIEQGYMATCSINEPHSADVDVKIKPDFIYKCIDEPDVYIFDIKSVQTGDLKAFWHSAKNLKYIWQSELYKHLLTAYFHAPVHFIFILVEKQAPHGVRFVELHSDGLPMVQIETAIVDYLQWQEQKMPKIYKNTIHTLWV